MRRDARTVFALFWIAGVAGCGGGSAAPAPTPTATPAPPNVPALSAVVSTPFPRHTYAVTGPVLGSDRNLWFVLSNYTGLSFAKLTTSGAYTAYPIPNSTGLINSPLVKGPDGALWFTMGNGNGYFMVRSDTSGNLSEYPAPYYGAMAMTTGSDGNLWYIGAGLRGASTLVGFSPSSHVAVATLNLPASLGAFAGSIVTNPKDGALLISTVNPAGFIKVMPGASPTIAAVYTAPNTAGAIQGFTVGNGTIFGLLWPTNSPPGPEQLVSIDENTYAVSFVNLPGGFVCSGDCVSGSTWFVPPLAVGPDGNVYAFDKSFSGLGNQNVPAHGFLSISPSGVLLGDADYNFGVDQNYLIAPAVTSGPDGNVWAAVSTPGGSTFVFKIAPP